MKKILMVTMSDHTSFQDGVFSMYENLKDRYKVTTLTIKNSDYPAPRNSDNLFIDGTAFANGFSLMDEDEIFFPA